MRTYQIGEGTFELYENGTASLCKGEAVPAAHIVVNGEIVPADGAIQTADGFALCFGEIVQQIAVTEQEKYCRFEAKEADERVEALLWGPFLAEYPGQCGEILGIARKDGRVVGIQSLNPKTVGGFPAELEQVHPMGERVVCRKGLREPMHVCAALDLHGGAALQAYCRNRTKIAYRDYLYAKKAMVLPVEGEDALIEGSAIVLFACAEEETLAVIGEMELAEGLPHTLVDGEWAKTSRCANSSYLVMDIDEENLDEALDCAEEAGFRCLYHPGPFKNWGHFDVHGGDDALKEMVDRAAARGVHLGMHTLSNFTTTDDPYVTPVPDEHLLKMGETTISASISETDTEIPIADDFYFEKLSTLNAVRIGDELIHYLRLHRENGQVYLSDCERGAWGTVACAHNVGDTAARLWDHPYRTLFPDMKLQKKFSQRLGELFNDIGFKRMSFDGLEGLEYTGHDEYASARYVKDCYDIWGPEVMSDASGLRHYNWHLHTYMNWGEPWYADMRNGMFDYRRSNQDYFKRNLFPAMMGWYTLKNATRKYEATTPDDIHWMLSKSAGYSAGFAFDIKREALKKHGKVHEYLRMIRDWETMRMYGEIPEDLKVELRDPKTEWELEKIEGGYLVYPVKIATFECSPEGAQPGMPSGADWMTYNPYQDQNMVFRMRAGDGRDEGGFSQIVFGAGFDFISFHAHVEQGQYFIYEGGTTAEIRDENFNLLETVQGDGSPLKLEQGIGMLSFKCVFDGEEPPYPQAKVFMRGEPRFVPCER